MAVHGHDGHLGRIAGSFDTGDIILGTQRQVDLTGLMTLDIIAPHAYLRVVLSGHGVLIGVIARVLGKLGAGGLQALEQLHRVLLNGALVVTDPQNLLRVGGEHHRRVG